MYEGEAVETCFKVGNQIVDRVFQDNGISIYLDDKGQNAIIANSKTGNVITSLGVSAWSGEGGGGEIVVNRD